MRLKTRFKYTFKEAPVMALQSHLDMVVGASTETAKHVGILIKKIQSLEGILIDAGILVEVQDAPPVRSDYTIQKSVPNPVPWSGIAGVPLYINKETKYQIAKPKKGKQTK